MTAETTLVGLSAGKLARETTAVGREITGMRNHTGNFERKIREIKKKKKEVETIINVQDIVHETQPRPLKSQK